MIYYLLQGVNWSIATRLGFDLGSKIVARRLRKINQDLKRTSLV
jgi:hypothetical protein